MKIPSALSVLGDPLLVACWGLLCAEGVWLSVAAARRPEDVAENPRFHALLLLPTLLFFGGMVYAYEPPYRGDRGLVNPYLVGHGNVAPIAVLAFPLGACWALFASRAVAFYVCEWIPQRLTGVTHMTVPHTFDKAEAAVKRGEIDLAFRLYTEAAREAPADAAPRLALAELFLARGARAQGEALLRQAADCAADVHARASFLFRVADLRRDAGDADGARRILRAFLDERPPAPYDAYARERLRALPQEKPAP